MALAQITLKGCSTYFHAGKTYKKDTPIPSTNRQEISWAKSNGHFMVLDMEAEKKALEAEIARIQAAQKVVEKKLAEKAVSEPSDGGSAEETWESLDGGE